MQRLREVCLAWLMPLAAGLLAALAFPPVEWRALVWIAWGPLLVSLRTATPTQAFRRGLLAGLAYWLSTMAWLLTLAKTGCDGATATGAWLGVSLYAAAYVAVFAMFAARILSSTRGLLWRLAPLWIACGWTALEFARMTLATGFPWNPLGGALFRDLGLIQIARFGGVYAVGWLIIFVNTGIAIYVLSWRAHRAKLAFRYGLPAVLLGLVLLARCYGACVAVHLGRAEAKASGTLRVVAIDPGIPQVKKWSEDALQENVATLLLQAGMAAKLEPDLTVFPETTLPGIPGLDPETDQLILDCARVLKGSAIMGAVEGEWVDEGARYYNSALLLDSSGVVVDRYRKQHLVPFGEYVPLEDKIPLVRKLVPLGFFSCVPGGESRVFTAGRASGMAVLICFEDAFPYLSRNAARAGAKRLVFITNDAWYPDTAAALQHVSHAVFRCVETGLWAIRSGNMGGTGFINPVGRMDLLDEQGRQSGFRSQELALTGPLHPTAYTRWGDLLWAWPCVILTCLACVLGGARATIRPLTTKETDHGNEPGHVGTADGRATHEGR